MKSILNLIYSTKATIWLLLIFAFAMATATFVENSYDTETAYKYIYGAKWFELVMVLLAVNFYGNIWRYNLISKKKWSGFLFHLAFIFIILGAGVSRYIGYEGLLHVREGESSNIMVSKDRVFKILAVDGTKTYRYNIPVSIKDSSDEINFNQTIDTKDNGPLEIAFKTVLPNVAETLVENVEGGVDCIQLNVLENGNESNKFMPIHSVIRVHDLGMAYNNEAANAELSFIEQDGKFYLKTLIPLNTVTLPLMTQSTLAPNSVFELDGGTQFSTTDNGLKFVFNRGYKNATKKLVSGTPAPNALSALMMDVKFKDKNYEVPVFVNADGLGDLQNAHIDGISLLMGYGEKEIELPFSIHLNDFILERYPGSSNPSSYASEVTINDPRSGAPQNFKIYMNHILDHDGYRFFQSSYDKDEKGTVLSVNHDFWGTWITYFGYFLLTVGFILTLFNKNSRFQILSKSVREIHRIRMNRTLVFFIALFSFGITNAQEIVLNPVSKEHAEKLGHLVTQTVDGRSEPVHTMAYDVMHKISRMDKFDFAGKGEMDAMQVFIDIILNAQYWKNQKLIYVREKSVADILAIQGKYASFSDLVDANGAPKLKQFVDDAFRKQPREQNPFDKEVIKVSERLDIFMMLTQGSLLRLFPEPVANSKVWISWDNPSAQIPMQDNYNLVNQLQIPQFNYNNVMGAYLAAAYQATSSGDYTKAEQAIVAIDNIQRNSANAELIPSKAQVDFEIYYNKANIFILLRNVYGALAIVLLILAYLENFLQKRNKIVSGMLNFFLVILGLAFIYHTYGMGLRWYLSGHAPWSNGYEALLLVGWAGILAGFSFIRYSKIPLAATALLAFFTLMTASHSSYDPQITNLQPVLKSYWLVIHVATLTISYGFLGLAFILGLFTLTLYLFKNQNNSTRLSLQIKELSHINEMNVTVGLMLATIGTFLGGIWANESWGRYWGWDAKETWALIITMVYSIVVHLRLVDKLRGDYLFATGTVLGFSSVLMTFIGVNYYLSKGMHSYGSGETPIFPIWAWIAIAAVFALIIAAWYKDKATKNHEEQH